MDPTARFSARADAYEKARPSYPDGAIAILRERFGLGPRSVVADLGSGTGIFTRLLLDAGAVVDAVEPNTDMRLAAERALRGRPGFHSVDGRAEATTLPDASVDLVTSAQAFHWFDVAATKREMLRILRPGAPAALVWNDRDLEGTPFLVEYEAILRRLPGYLELQGKANTPSKFDAVFGPGRWSRDAVPNEQDLDQDGLVHRVLSASYAPEAGTPRHDALVAELSAAFERYSEGGRVRIRYTTVIIGGRPA